MAEDMVAESLILTRAIHDRYHAAKRNPFNEIECSDHYARAMASYALLSSWSGFRYSAVEETLWFGPLEGKRPFQVFFSADSGHGTIAMEKGSLRVTILEGSLAVDMLVLRDGKKTIRKKVGKIARPQKPIRINW